MEMIEILGYEHANHGKKIGYVNVYVPKTGMEIHRIAHFQSGDKRWLNYSTYVKELPDGKKVFLPFCRYRQNTHNDEFLQVLQEELKRYFEKHNIKPPAPIDLTGSFEGDLPF